MSLRSRSWNVKAGKDESVVKATFKAIMSGAQYVEIDALPCIIFKKNRDTMQYGGLRFVLVFQV